MSSDLTFSLSNPSKHPAPPTPRTLNILLIGGKGFVGSQLAPILRSRGHHVIIGSRNGDSALGIVGRENWKTVVDNADVIALLSVINNDVDAPVEQFRAVNVDLPLELARLLVGHPQKRLILFGSDHSDSKDAFDMYAQSKAELAKRLRDIAGAGVTMLILSPVHGKDFVKKLAFVDNFPGPLRSMSVAMIGALRTLSHAELIADAIENVAKAPVETLVFQRVVDDQDRNLVYRSVTRLLDLAFTIAVLVFFGWLMAVLAILIRSSSAGPALFRQKRVGRNGQIFYCYKFRTMYIDTPQVATHQVSANSTTAIGKRLRKWKLDELPQVFNILANQMSLVGPRPCLPSQLDLVDARRRLGVLAAKPGVTGWSQIQGIDMSNPERLAQCDAEFCARRSIPFYVMIAILTFLGKGNGDRIR
jgi:lipopolysaccharide/colanic/teichoic acid biosynthesis glycosyltransferase